MLAPLSPRTYHRLMSITWYFLLAVAALILVILSVPDDGPSKPDAPEASHSWLMPGALVPGVRTC